MPVKKIIDHAVSFESQNVLYSVIMVLKLPQLKHNELLIAVIFIANIIV